MWISGLGFWLGLEVFCFWHIGFLGMLVRTTGKDYMLAPLSCILGS
ncbi:hypothetical protein X559_2822 [Paenilisteria newyorkensis]|nr:hypothetical protein X559_2822 [Listeria newyorkensis]